MSPDDRRSTAARVSPFIRSLRVVTSLVLGAGALAMTASACAPDEVDDGDTASDEIRASDLVLESQLRGHDLPDRTLHLTFDDGPGGRTTELAEFLGDRGIVATFFINGANVPGRQQALTAIVGHGHLLANHTQNHLLLPRESSDTTLREISATDAIILGVQPDRPLFLRTPYAGWNGRMHRAVSGSPMNKYVGPIHWDIGTRTTAASAADWDCWAKGFSVQRCGDLYLSEIRSKRKGIVLLHDLHGRTVDLTKYLVPKLLAEGFRFGAIDDAPSIKRAMTSTRPALTASQCYSGTLLRAVPANTCVQSTADRATYRCVDGDWTASAGNDSRCVQRYRLP